jgi:hypothetical protein
LSDGGFHCKEGIISIAVLHISPGIVCRSVRGLRQSQSTLDPFDVSYSFCPIPIRDFVKICLDNKQQDMSTYVVGLRSASCMQTISFSPSSTSMDFHQLLRDSATKTFEHLPVMICQQRFQNPVDQNRWHLRRSGRAMSGT